MSNNWIILSMIYAVAISIVCQTPQGFSKRRSIRTVNRHSRFPYAEKIAGYDRVSKNSVNRRSDDEISKEIEEFTTLPDPEIFLELLDNMSASEYHKNAIAQWKFESNITETTRRKALKSSARLAQFQKIIWKAAMRYDWQNFNDPFTKRQFKTFSVLGSAALPDDKFSELDRVINKMESIYSTATINPYVKGSSAIRESKSKSKTEHELPKRRSTKPLRLEPDLVKLMAESEDVEELAYVWRAWRDATGKKMRKDYIAYVELTKEVARLNNFSSVADYWTHAYEDGNFEETISILWQEIKPFYLELHAYVRNRLRAKYGPEVIPDSGYIPAHVLGDMWTQSWIHLNKATMPYPAHAIPDMTNALKKNNFTKIEYFELAHDFFRSIGFPMLPEEFWHNSIIERPKDNKTELVCHGSAWDMYDGKDFRIKMCTEVTYDDLVIVHHEMGHVYYYIQYKEQPVVFREGANPGFHEAIGDTIALSVSSLPHACGLGLVENSKYEERMDINYLYMIALQKVAFLPFAYCVDKWRWTIFTDEVTPDTYNSLWWKLRAEIQGIEPPINREKTDFDPGSKYHVAANVPYIRYFVSFIIQFQFYEAVCLIAGQYDPNDDKRPLHRCDIYDSKEAGIAMRQMMRLGSSVPWPEAMERLTGHREMKTGGLMSYFRPLYNWLKDENKRSKEPVGF